jgi:predicted metal-dependent phosphotriesterase family hydrolase
MEQDSRSSVLSRREMLELLGAGALAASLPRRAFAAPTFPKGAVIRTVLKDYAPEELAGSATLFHEHLSFAPDFMTRWTRYAAETRAANAPPVAAGAAPTAGRGPPTPPPAAAPAPFFMSDQDLMSQELTIGKQEGIGCIVDGGHPDMGRDIASLRQLSTKSGMPIVAGGGLYTQPFYPTEIAAMSEEQIAQMLIK